MEDFKRRFILGKTDYGDLWITIEYTDDKLSITGVEGPKKNGDCRGSCGQCVDAAREIDEKFADMWKRWHLNDMRAGSPAQEDFLRAHKAEFPGYLTSYYDWAVSLLTKNDLHPDYNHYNYTYGSAWLHEEVPEDILEYFASFPDRDDHPWGD